MRSAVFVRHTGESSLAGIHARTGHGEIDRKAVLRTEPNRCTRLFVQRDTDIDYPQAVANIRRRRNDRRKLQFAILAEISLQGLGLLDRKGHTRSRPRGNSDAIHTERDIVVIVHRRKLRKKPAAGNPFSLPIDTVVNRRIENTIVQHEPRTRILHHRRGKSRYAKRENRKYVEKRLHDLKIQKQPRQD